MNFLYEAIDPTGKTVLGKIDGANETEARQRLHQMGYRPQTLAPTQPVVAPPTPGRQDLTTLPGASQTLMGQTPQDLAQRTSYGGQITAPTPYGAPTGQQLTQANTPARTGSIILAGSAARTVAKSTQARTGTLARPATAVTVPADASTLGGVKTGDLMFFFQQLATLVRSGMTIYTALDNLAARTPNQNLAQTAREMAETARTGGRVSDMMARYPRIYPEHIIGMVRAGELGGFLEIALSEIALNYEQNVALYRGMWLPKSLATQGLFVLALAIPLFPSLFGSVGANATAGLGPFLQLYLQRVLFGTLPAAVAIYLLVRLAAGRLQLPQFRTLRDSWSLRLPPFGELQRKAALAAFVRMLRKLTHAGVAPIQAWEGAMNTASNVVIRDKLSQSYALMQQGKSLPEAFAATGLFANQMEQLLTTGHEAGQVVESLDMMADYYQREIDDASEKSRRMMKLLGRVAMLVMGGIAIVWLMHSCYQGTFDYVNKNFGE